MFSSFFKTYINKYGFLFKVARVAQSGTARDWKSRPFWESGFKTNGYAHLIRKVQHKAGRAHFVRPTISESPSPGVLPGWCSSANHPALSRPGLGFEQLFAQLARMSSIKLDSLATLARNGRN